MPQEVAVLHLLKLLLQLLVCARAKLVAHDDVDDRGCNGNRRRNRDGGGERETQTKRHGSRST
jgi:hypothetical protein